jgi:hypothetical protein
VTLFAEVIQQLADDLARVTNRSPEECAEALVRAFEAGTATPELTQQLKLLYESEHKGK